MTVPSSNRTAAVLAEMVRMAEPIVTLKANLRSSEFAQRVSNRHLSVGYRTLSFLIFLRRKEAPYSRRRVLWLCEAKIVCPSGRHPSKSPPSRDDTVR